MGTRSRFVATALLVLIALGGAGLAVAADRVQNPYNRPEVTWAADHAAQPWIATLAGDLSAIDSAATDLAKAGRDTLGNLQSLNLDTTRAAVDAGDTAASTIGGALADLNSDQAAANANIERWRVGPDTTTELDAIDKAVVSSAELPRAWQRVKARATNVAGLVDDLQRHDSLVFRATTAGRQGSLADALSTLGDAGKALASARAARDSLGAGATTDTLDQLLARYAAYDSALSGLYSYLGSGGAQSGATFNTLNKVVEDAQAALPTDNGVFSIIVGEAAGTEITDALVDLEQARGDINAALDASTTNTP